jgi:hypothetical protein
MKQGCNQYHGSKAVVFRELGAVKAPLEWIN